MPAYPIPATLIAKLAVDNPVKGQGLGGELLAHALYRIVRASQEIGIFAVRVDAIALQAKKFYLKHEFIPFQDKELSFFQACVWRRNSEGESRASVSFVLGSCGRILIASRLCFIDTYR
jgi:N-acetylglutamate synthase-like GNAT family acetyltransferase